MKKKKQKPVSQNHTYNPKLAFGEEVDYFGQESYKMLRTNLMFSFTNMGEKCCRVIGITSAVHGDGKSITSANLAYSLAEAKKKVLLLECDQRMPSLAKYLALNSSPGLSNLLVGLNSVPEVISVYEKNPCMHIMVAGDVPPNPSELLGSEQMSCLLEGLKEDYDYMILDLPPIGAVTDALVVSKSTDGMVLVVRDLYTERRDVASAVRQLQLVDANILGFVYNCSAGNKSRYARRYKKKYKEYYQCGGTAENV